MRTIAVRPFSAESVDAADVAGWLSVEAAAWLTVPGVLEVADDGDLALEGSIELAGDELRLSAALVDSTGAGRGSWTEALPAGEGPQLGQMLARATLLALGEEASAPPEIVASAVAPAAFLALCRAHRLLASGEVDDGCAELLRVLEDAPGFDAAQRLLLGAASEAIGGDRMPAFFSALERLVELQPDGVEALLALGDYRALHFDDEGARDLFLEARDRAPDPVFGAEALARLAALAMRRGQGDEAIAHLREAIRLADDGATYLQLGLLLAEKDALESLRMLTRAAVLSPSDARVRLELARALRRSGDDPERALAEAAEAVQLAQGDAELAAEAQAELEQLERR